MRTNPHLLFHYADRAGCRAEGRVKCGESRTTRVAVAKQLQTAQLAHNGLILIYYSIYADRAGCRAKGRVKCGESRTTRVAVAKQLQTAQLAHNGLVLIYYSIYADRAGCRAKGRDAVILTEREISLSSRHLRLEKKEDK